MTKHCILNIQQIAGTTRVFKSVSMLDRKWHLASVNSGIESQDLGDAITLIEGRQIRNLDNAAIIKSDCSRALC